MQQLELLVPPGDELRPLVTALPGRPDFLQYVLKREATEGAAQKTSSCPSGGFHSRVSAQLRCRGESNPAVHPAKKACCVRCPSQALPIQRVTAAIS